MGRLLVRHLPFRHSTDYERDHLPGRCFTSLSVVSPCSTTLVHPRSSRLVSTLSCLGVLHRLMKSAIDINLPIFFALYVGYKFWCKTKMVSASLRGTEYHCSSPALCARSYISKLVISLQPSRHARPYQTFHTSNSRVLDHPAFPDSFEL